MTVAVVGVKALARNAYWKVNLASSSTTSRSVVKTLKGVWLCGTCVASILVFVTTDYNGDAVGLWRGCGG